ncbi:hypothetical protein [Pseudomonas paeninsulae]|uniref:hypothetical protein n=1 Tax=Pseudomonas paeninsulae TaxID=3110772 RepID=UPI002D764D75|nr:hypothetical protein [Pseudomonas sp. IT1137]
MQINVASEFSQTDLALAEFLQPGVERIQRVLREALAARTGGELSATADVDALASYLHCVMSTLR